MQEFRTAKEAVLSVHPGAQIIEKRVDSYPIEVKVFSPSREIIFKTSQRNLFSKYADARRKSIEQIQEAVSKC